MPAGEMLREERARSLGFVSIAPVLSNRKRDQLTAVTATTVEHRKVNTPSARKNMGLRQNVDDDYDENDS